MDGRTDTQNLERTLFLYGKLQGGNNNAKNVGGVIVLSACRLVMHYISTKLCEIILNGIKVIERTRFHY